LALSTDALAARLAYAKHIALEAGQVLRKTYYGSMEVRYKGAVDPVTNADLESEKLITDAIAREFPGDVVIAEEEHKKVGDPEEFWLIDPLDGTVNFSHRIPWFAVSIAFVNRREPLAGVVYNPVLGRCYSAMQGRGAYLNGVRLKVSDRDKLRGGLLATGFPYHRAETGANFVEHERALRAVQDVRRMGSASLDICMVAEGLFDAYYEFGLGPWDFAAGWVIASEAGAVCLDPRGNQPVVGGDSFLCATPALAQQVVATINGNNRSL
jgi:myo-inositol-1(or 4)-monophosphatase